MLAPPGVFPKSYSQTSVQQLYFLRFEHRKKTSVFSLNLMFKLKMVAAIFHENNHAIY